MRKLLFITLITIMLISLMSGCGKKDTPASPPFMLENGDMEKAESLYSGSWWKCGGSKDPVTVEYATDPSDPNNQCLKMDGEIAFDEGDDPEGEFIAVGQIIKSSIRNGKK